MPVFDRVYVEISNVCNLKCDFCPSLSRQNKVMDAQAFAHIAHELKGRTREICLHLMGEPLQHPELETVLEVAARSNLPVNLTTNGVLLAGNRVDLCLHPIIRQMNISIHSFEANFGIRDVTPYMNRVFSFTRLAFARRPDLYINYRIWDLHEPAALTAQNAAIRNSIEQEFGITIAPVDVRRQKGYKVTGRLYLNFDSRFVWPDLKQEFRSESGFCHALKGHVGVQADGTVVPCCLDKDGVMALGNLHTQTLEQILQSPRAQTMRQGFQQGQLREPLCQRCDFVKRFDRKARKLKSSDSGESVCETETATSHHEVAPAALEK